MKLEVELEIDATPQKIWQAITDIDGAAERISGINSVEVLERPEKGQGVVGLKWREARTMFGQEATEVMWITDARENEFYQTRAESHGSIYVSRFDIEPGTGGRLLRMSFTGEARTIGAKIMSAIFSLFLKKSLTRAMLQDLKDIKSAVERG